MYDRDYATAERKFQRALEIDPADAAAHEQYAQYLAIMGRGPQALVEIEQARKLDPFSPSIKQTTGMIYYYQRRYDEALEALKQAREADPNLSSAHEWSGFVYEQKSMRLEAIEQYLRARLISTTKPDYPTELKSAYVKSGWQGFWRSELAYLKDRAATSYVSASRIADIYRRLEDRQQALAWLARAFEERDGRIVALKVDPAYDGFRGEPQFDELSKRVSQVP